MTLVGMGRPNQVGVALKAHSRTTWEPENLRTSQASGRRQARERRRHFWHQQCLADNIQPLGIFLLGSPARKLFPLGHLHRLSGTWQTGEAGSFPGGFLRQGRPILRVSVGAGECVDFAGGWGAAERIGLW